MKTLIFTDSHGRDPSKLVDWAVQSEGIEKLVSLGDLDTPGVLRNILDKTKQYNIESKILIGNHDYHYVKRYDISGRQMRKSAEKYADEWEKERMEKQFILDAIDGKISGAGLIVLDNKVVYTHASLVDIDRADPDVPDFVWGRILNNQEKLDKSFNEMERLNDCRLLFRGHDHVNAITVQKEGITSASEFGYWGMKYKIDIENARTIVSVGAFYEGEFVLYDSKTKKVDFKSWNFLENKPY